MKLPQIKADTVRKPKTIDEIDVLFEKLLSVDLIKPDYNKIKKAFFDIIGFLPFVIASFDKKDLKDLSLYRTRPVSQIKDEELGWVSSFGAPPLVKDVGIQRASWKCRNVFYGGDSFETALLESKRLNEGEEFYVSKWIFDIDKLNDDTYDFRILIDSELPRNNPWFNITNGFAELHETFRKSYGLESAIELEYIHKRLCNLFLIENKEYYPLTAFLTDYQIFNKDNTDQIIFSHL